MIVDAESPRIDPDAFERQLSGLRPMPHQLALLEAARRLEQGEVRGVSTNVGLMVAPPGAGKTAVAVAMAMLFDPPASNRVRATSSTATGNMSIVVHREDEAEDHEGNGKTLIVVPKTILKQWRTELTKYGCASDGVYFVGDRPSFNKVNSPAAYDAAEIVIMADKFLHTYRETILETVYGRETWTRLIVDEWHAVLSNVPRFQSTFVWLVSASTKPVWTRRKNESYVDEVPVALLHSRMHQMFAVHPEGQDAGQDAWDFVTQARLDMGPISDDAIPIPRDRWRRAIPTNTQACIHAASIVLHHEFAEESMSLPPPRVKTHLCRMDRVACFVATYVPALQELVDAGAGEAEIRENMNAPVSVFARVLEMIDREILRERAAVAYREALAEEAGNRDAPRWDAVRERMAEVQVADARRRLRVLETRRERVVETMSSDSTCPICMDDEVPAGRMVALGCSGTHFLCAGCTLRLVTAEGAKRCPLCRERVEDLILPETGDGESAGQMMKTKLETCLELVTASEGGVIVYTSHWTMVKRMVRALCEAGVVAESLDKSGSVARIVQEFNEGRVRALVLDPSNPTGLNLQKASTVVIMNEVNPQVTQQVIGRAQRIGREGALDVHFLRMVGP